jgi:hypothetical protein
MLAYQKDPSACSVRTLPCGQSGPFRVFNQDPSVWSIRTLPYGQSGPFRVVNQEPSVWSIRTLPCGQSGPFRVVNQLQPHYNCVTSTSADTTAVFTPLGHSVLLPRLFSVSLLKCPRAWQPCRIKSLHSPGHKVTPAELRDKPHIIVLERHSDVTISLKTHAVTWTVTFTTKY